MNDRGCDLSIVCRTLGRSDRPAAIASHDDDLAIRCSYNRSGLQPRFLECVPRCIARTLSARRPFLRRSAPLTALRTHYDNLHVTRDAPAEVVRAAYQALASKLHPDRNPDDPQAESAMKLVNAAYDVLADPIKRAQHDRWIVQMEARAQTDEPHHALVIRPPDAREAGATGDPASDDPHSIDPVAGEVPRQRASTGRHGWSIVALAGALGLALVGGAVWLMESESASDSARRAAASPPWNVAGDAATAAGKVARQGEYIRPERAPGGEAWPAESGYIGGFKLLFNDGQSTVTLDNSANPSDVYAKLYAHREARPFAVRWAFVKGKSSFVLGELRPGRYEVRYRDLDNGVVTRSEPFELREGSVAEGTRFTAARIPLQKVIPRDGQALFDPDF